MPTASRRREACPYHKRLLTCDSCANSPYCASSSQASPRHYRSPKPQVISAGQAASFSPFFYLEVIDELAESIVGNPPRGGRWVTEQHGDWEYTENQDPLYIPTEQQSKEERRKRRIQAGLEHAEQMKKWRKELQRRRLAQAEEHWDWEKRRKIQSDAEREARERTYEALREQRMRDEADRSAAEFEERQRESELQRRREMPTKVRLVGSDQDLSHWASTWRGVADEFVSSRIPKMEIDHESFGYDSAVTAVLWARRALGVRLSLLVEVGQVDGVMYMVRKEY